MVNVGEVTGRRFVGGTLELFALASRTSKAGFRHGGGEETEGGRHGAGRPNGAICMSRALLAAALLSTIAATVQATSGERSAAEALAEAPKLQLQNGVLRAVLLRPDRIDGFYRGTRFDWGGMIVSLRYRDTEYYGPWFDAVSPDVRNFAVRGGRIVVGMNSRAMGPADTFDADRPPGWDEAKPGGTFLNIGVGVLRKPDDGKPYSPFTTYEIVDGGRWSVRATRDRAELVHEVADRASGYGYSYRKTIRLQPGKPVMVISHSLRNTGKKPIATTLYNHNFLTLAGPEGNRGVSVAVPFALAPTRAPQSDAIVLGARGIRYVRALRDGETASTELRGFGPLPSDYDVTVTNARGAGYRVTADRPMSKLAVWSIRTNVSVEPHLAFDIAPSRTAVWTYTYTYMAAGSR